MWIAAYVVHRHRWITGKCYVCMHVTVFLNYIAKCALIGARWCVGHGLLPGCWACVPTLWAAKGERKVQGILAFPLSCYISLPVVPPIHIPHVLILILFVQIVPCVPLWAASVYIEPLSLRRTHKIGNHYLLPSFYFTTGADALVYIIFGKCLFACGIVYLV